jgi:glycosyltransferase involved in cell wall biosynthesis
MLAVLTTHPIQYQVPLWQAMAKDGRVPFEVWYLTSHATKPTRDREFGKEFAWDLDLLAGYPHKFLDVASDATPNSFWKCRLREKLRDRLRTSGARTLWINGWQVAAYWQAVSEAKLAGVEVWLRGESNDLAPTPLWKAPIKRIALDWLFKRIDRFLYIGSANKRLYQKFGVPDEKLFQAPYAVDNARFATQAEGLRGHKSAIRSQWNIPEGAFVILFCGKFIPKKRPADLIAAVSRLLSREQGAGARGQESGNASHVTRHTSLKPHLLFVGSGELGDAMRAACHVVYDTESLNSSHVTGHASLPVASGSSPSSQLPASSFRKPAASFAGFLNQTEISRAYVAADVLVLPSDYNETWGLVVNEAMASGLPCIVSDHCGCAEDLGTIPPNAIYECGNIESLTLALMKFKDAEGNAVKASDLKNYSFEQTVKTIAGVWSR